MAERTCSIDGCERTTRTSGAEWCNTHYQRWRKHGDPLVGRPLPPKQGRYNRKPKPPKPCSIDGCDAPHHSKGFCEKHYVRLRRNGDPTRTLLPGGGDLIRGDHPKRFMSKVEKTETCWLWTAGLNPFGYGVFFFEDKSVQAHRWSYEHHVGPIPDGLEIDHLCAVRNCVRPDHLEPVTRSTNMRRAYERRRSSAN